MRISALELSGFKSFHRKTRIEFHKGANGIVGPNGCGKSNVVDAVRWVIGEQNPRMLRAEVMEDLISDGTVSLKPVGMAEVTLVLSEVPGRGFNDVSITRRYFRGGESEYSINGAQCRLKDIVDVFLDTGAGARSHSIIGQGEVENLIMAKPEEKRRLIDEVAGIGKFKARKKETQSRLKQTGENLEKIRGISKDANRRKETLRRQAEQARKLNELSGGAARLELLMLGAQRLESEEKMREALRGKTEIEKSTGELETGKSGIVSRLKEFEQKVRALETEAGSSDAEILAVREKINAENSAKELSARRTADIEAFISRLESEKLILEQQGSDIKNETAKMRSEAENADTETGRLKVDVETVSSELSALKDGTRGDRNGFEEVRESFFSAVEQCDNAEEGYRNLTAEIERLSVRSGYLSEQKEVLLDEKRKISGQREQFLSQIEEISGAQEQSEKERKGFEDGLSSFGGEHGKLLDEIDSLKESRTRAASRLGELENIRKSFEWLPESSRSFLMGNKTGGVLGVLSDYVTVPPEYAKAFEAALGERLGWIVVGTGDDASAAIEKLRMSEAGRATFLPAGAGAPEKTFSVPAGARPITEIVRVKGTGGAAVRKLLEGICVVDTLGDAFECAPRAPELSFATLEGDFLDSSGAVSGGWTTGGVFERDSEIESLTDEVARLDKQIKTSLEESGNFEIRIDDLKEKMTSLDDNIRADRARLGSLERDLEGFTFALEGKETKLTGLETEITAADSELEEKNARLGDCRAQLEDLRGKRDVLKERLSGFEEKNSELESRETELSDRLSSLKVSIASLEQNKAGALRSIEGLDLREKDIAARSAENAAEIARKQEEKKELIESSGSAKSRIETLEAELEQKQQGGGKIREDRSAVMAEIQALREKVDGLDKSIEQVRARRGDIEVRIKTMENNIEYVDGKITEVKEKTGAQMPGEDEIRAADVEETKTEFAELRAKIDKLGLVNLLAPDEYEEAEKEYDFLESQIEDLEKSAISLKKSISQLDRESAEKFTEAFEEVDKKFRELLPTLFKGGEGRLVMTNPDDPIDTGIDISVKPGGKKAQSMSLLSGGEKALSAIAFIIASCLVRPLPFMILDEIDAPLDDSNTGRFASLVKDISRNSQTLVVTHNKTTISSVDALIGVTASKAANSAVVSVDLAKAV
ncbi:MAG: chromosome segregation protein SMC [Candidatus Mycalebacterium zealandia]|nr:MAG: chromosome segregation protein SMC [Candidatus Mycalebacterium zealandia]